MRGLISFVVLSCLLVVFQNCGKAGLSPVVASESSHEKASATLLAGRPFSSIARLHARIDQNNRPKEILIVADHANRRLHADVYAIDSRTGAKTIECTGSSGTDSSDYSLLAANLSNITMKAPLQHDEVTSQEFHWQLEVLDNDGVGTVYLVGGGTGRLEGHEELEQQLESLSCETLYD